MQARWMCLTTLLLVVASLTTPLARAEAIAVIDSGINVTPGLAGRVDKGADFIDFSLPPQDETVGGHGTVVSRIVASIDSRNRILPVRVLDADGYTDGITLVRGINFASNSHARVLNLSLGDDSNTFDRTIMSSLQNAASKGKLIVFAAGNDSRRGPTFPANTAKLLGGAALAVGALDRNGDIAWYSNRAGSAKDYFLLAPGYTRFSPYIGTSFAAPYVSGTAAAILAQNPRLTASQVSEIILTTARDMGAPGVDAIYGHGALDTQAALAAKGPITVPSGSGGSGSALAVVGLGAGIAAALIYYKKRHRLLGPDVDPDGLEQVVVLDQYDRPYTVNLGDFIQARDDSLGLDQLMQSLKRRSESSIVGIGENLSLAVWSSQGEGQRFARATTDVMQEIDTDWSLSLQQGGNTGIWSALNMRLDPRQFFGAADEVSPFAVFDRRSLTAPYAGFASSGNMAMTGYRTVGGHDLRLGLVDMNGENDRYGAGSRSLLFEASSRPHPAWKIGMQLTMLAEQGSLLGGSPGGAFSVDHAETLATGLLTSLRLSDRWTMQGMYSQGFTRVSDRESSLLDAFSGLRSDSYAIGLSGRDLVGDGDSLGITVSRPLHVLSGQARLNVPSDIDVWSGEVFFDREMIDFADTPRVTDIELGYHRPLNRQSGFAAFMRYRHDPSGVFDDSGTGRYGAMVSVSSVF